MVTGKMPLVFSAVFSDLRGWAPVLKSSAYQKKWHLAAEHLGVEWVGLLEIGSRYFALVSLEGAR